MLPAMALAQQERVLSFESVVAVQTDAVVRVHETIRVQVASGDMQHGLYRDFPVHYSTADGKKYDVSLTVLSVQRDGADAPYTIERESGMTRLAIGDDRTHIPTGVHVYSITYETDGYIRFLEDTDELQWSVTGNHWQYATDTVRATLLLPDSARVVQSSAYVRNSEGAETPHAFEDSTVTVVLVTNLDAKEEFVLQSSWEKGIIAEMREAQQRALFWKNNFEYVVGGIGILLVFIWLCTFWLRGFHQESGEITVQSTIPKGLSPAAVRVVNRMGYDRKTMATALISMAVKGALSIENKAGKKMLLHKNADANNALTADEELLHKALFAKGDTAILQAEQKEHVRYSESVLQQALQRQCEHVYFRTNTRALWGGIALSCIVVGSLLIPVVSGMASIPFRIVPFVLVLLVLGAQNVWFYRLLKVPTERGRALRDHIEGLRHFIMGEKEVGKDAVPMTVEHFEQYLPYALALDVEHLWGQSLATVGEQRVRGFGASSKSETTYVYNPS